MRRGSYHDDTNVDVTDVDMDRHGMQQHAYYDPSSYHYLPPPQQPLVDHHIYQHQHQHQHQHQNQHNLQHLPDPVWPSTANNDAYLHVDPAADYHFHPTAATAPLDEISLPPPHPHAHAHPHAHPHPSLPVMVQPAPRRSSNTRTKKTSSKTNATSTKKMKAAASKEAGTADSTYVLRIHEMLENAEKERQTHIVSWQPHGRAFRIHNEPLFVSQIMPRYFQAKLGSFRRWLRAWGFVRMTEGKDRGAWYHRFFVRGVTSLCKDMTRQQMAHAMLNWPPAGQVPNFYAAASGSTLSEHHHHHHHHHHPPPQVDPAGPDGAVAAVPPNPYHVPLATNPKRLRGTILEDLRQMLEDAEKEGQTHIVSWLPHGRAFKIQNKALFQQQIMGRYFRTEKLAHLSDTLRIWGFRRLKTIGPDKGAFYHKYFVRGDPSRSRHLPRVQMKACMDDFPPPEGEPNLYEQPPLEPPIPPGTAAKAPHAARNQVSTSNHMGQSQSDMVGPPAFPVHVQGTQLGGAAVPFPLQHEYDASMRQVLSPSTGSKEDAINRCDGTYVLRLHEMLEDAEKEGNQHIVSWQPHGRAFRIHKEKEFVEHVMPKYFKAKMPSFLRWCRAWGFVRMTEGRDRGAWYHRYFVRGVTSLARNMSRQQMLKAMEDWLPAGHLPNFYASGIGEVLSETRKEPMEPPPNVTCKNPKRLRGTVPEDLRQMLEEAEEEGNTHIVAWLPHGRAFKVYNKAAFSKTILPRYFKASKYTYFSDALRMWGWQRLKHGRDEKGSYYHKLFVKGQPQLTRHLTRIQMKTSMAPWPPLEGEPNLHAPPANDDDTGQAAHHETIVAAPVPAAAEHRADDNIATKIAAPVGGFEDPSELKDSILWQTTM